MARTLDVRRARSLTRSPGTHCAARRVIQCPVCRNKFPASDVISVLPRKPQAAPTADVSPTQELQDPLQEQWRSSAKLRVLVAEICKLRDSNLRRRVLRARASARLVRRKPLVSCRDAEA